MDELAEEKHALAVDSFSSDTGRSGIIPVREAATQASYRIWGSRRDAKAQYRCQTESHKPGRGK